MFLLALESDNFSPFILEVPFGVNCRAERYANSAPVHYSIRIPKPQIPSTKPGPRPEGGDSEGETGNPPAGWESEGQISGFQVSGVPPTLC
jgi:hypothetical protein